MIRHKATKIVRDYLDEKDFGDGNSMLTKSTPEGARDYLVPSKLSWYVLCIATITTNI